MVVIVFQRIPPKIEATSSSACFSSSAKVAASRRFNSHRYNDSAFYIGFNDISTIKLNIILI